LATFHRPFSEFQLWIGAVQGSDLRIGGSALDRLGERPQDVSQLLSSFNWDGSRERVEKVAAALVATESQLGRTGTDRSITRPSLMKELVARRVRITAQRRLLVSIIQDSPRHLDAAQLLELAKKQDPEIDRATVYRTIGLLKSKGLIDELDLMHLQGEKHYYEAKTNRDHCHMACFRCGAIMEYASPSFEKLKDDIAKRSGFSIRVVRLEVGGFCKRCRKKKG
jgi:Fur family transcriptional regulator, ferric uptake regulator